MIKIMKKTMVCVLLFIFFGISFDSKVVEAKNKKISTNRVKTIRQNVQYTYTDKDGKVKTVLCNEKVGCGINGCNKHGENHIKKGLSEGKDIDEIIDCKSGSNLYMIKVSVNEVSSDNKMIQKYYTLKKLGFCSLQGSCVDGDYLYIAYSDKGRSNEAEAIRKDTDLSATNLTVIVKLKISKDFSVVNVEFIKGVEQIDDAINYLGHANDMAYHDNKLQTTWYELKRSGKRFTIGYIDVSDGTKGMATNLGKGKKYKKRSMFGITKYKNKGNGFAIGIRDKNDKTKRYVDYYKYVKRPGNKQIKYQYIRIKRLFDIKKIGKRNVCQCMASRKNYIYVNVFKMSKEGDNNAIHIYKNIKKKGKGKKYKKEFTCQRTVIVKDPEVINSSGKSVNVSDRKWEIEGFGHLKKNKFYCVMVMPEPEDSGLLTNKQAYLTTFTMK